MSFRVKDLMIHATPLLASACPNPATVCPASTCPTPDSHCSPNPPSMCDTPTHCPGQPSKTCSDPSHCNHPTGTTPTHHIPKSADAYAPNLLALKTKMAEMMAAAATSAVLAGSAEPTQTGADQLIAGMRGAFA